MIPAYRGVPLWPVLLALLLPRDYEALARDPVFTRARRFLGLEPRR